MFFSLRESGFESDCSVYGIYPLSTKRVSYISFVTVSVCLKFIYS